MQSPAQLPKRSPDTHKGDYGHVFVLGGSRGLTGAVCLCARAALRAGCGLVTVGVPQSLNPIFEAKLTEVMSLPLAEREGGSLGLGAFIGIEKIIDKIDVIALGPGASQQPVALQILRKVVSEIDRPLVIDADGINALAEKPEVLKKRKAKNLILTPHLGEFSRLIGVDIARIKKEGKDLAKKFASRYNLTLVLKGHQSLVVDSKNLFENTTGNPGMATAGSGDVLTGIIAALCAQGLDTFDAAKLGTYLHGLAGDFAAQDKTEYSLIASDIIDYLPKALKTVIK